MTNSLRVYTDASFKDGVSTHHWGVFDVNGKRIKRRSFKACEEDSNKAELQSINSAIQWLYKKDKQNVTIYTDSMYCVRLLAEHVKPSDSHLNISHKEKTDIDFLKFQMKGFNIQIKWVSRCTKKIKLADYYCGELMGTVLKRKEYDSLTTT